MSVYVDKAQNKFRRMNMCHMIGDTLEELHEMADRIGIKREWFQEDASTPHYDLSKTRRKLALEAGAIELDRKEFVAVIQRLRAEKIAAQDT